MQFGESLNSLCAAGAKPLPYLQRHHVGSILLAKAKVVHEELEHLEGLLLTHVQKQDSSHEADALTVAHFLVQQRIGFEEVKEGQLPRPKLHGKVRMSRKCPSWKVTEIKFMSDGLIAWR